MGKVQDTIRKIGDRTGQRGPIKDIALQIPAQRPATKGSFPTDAASVEVFLTRLKASPSESVASELTRALQHSNRLVNTPSKRLQIVRQFEPVAQNVLSELNCGFTGVDLPYPASAVVDFELTTTLLQEMSASYKIILLDVIRRRGHLPRKHRLPVIYQAMKHLTECGLRISQSYQLWPNKLWRDINTLYLCAEREQGVDIELHSNTKLRTIRQLYCQCCAFAVCAGSHLPSSTLSQLFRLLGKHSNVLHLTDIEVQIKSDSLYSVALDSAHPPILAKFSKYQPGQAVRFFNIDPLTALLPATEATDDEKHITQSFRDSAPEHLYVGQFRNVLTGSTERLHARSIRQTRLHIETGIKEIHASLLPAVGKRNTSSQYNSTPQFGTEWIVENCSSGGLGLKWSGIGNCHINIGELISHQTPTLQENTSNTDWQIGIVRWIQSDGQDELHCGVETLASYATAVTIRSANFNQSELHTSSTQATSSQGISQRAYSQNAPTESLLLNEHSVANRPPMLLLPKNLYKIGEKVHIQQANTNRLIKLIENFPIGGKFDCFGFLATS